MSQQGEQITLDDLYERTIADYDWPTRQGAEGISHRQRRFTAFNVRRWNRRAAEKFVNSLSPLGKKRALIAFY